MSRLASYSAQKRPASQGAAGAATWVIAGLFCAAFALMAVFFPFAIASGTNDVWSRVQGLFTSAEYSFGSHSASAQYPLYLR